MPHLKRMADARKSIKNNKKTSDKIGAAGIEATQDVSNQPESSPNPPTAKKRRRKEKKKVIEISLWVNNVKYEHGCLCTFCAKSPAIYHCPECPDFYCVSCDATVHSHKKRRGHVRTKLSKLTLDAAAKIVTYATRYHGHLRTLQAKCRAVFRRYFDRVTLCHYYSNPVYKTTSWRKPYCLRREELFPFMDPESAASRVQTLYRLWKARTIAIRKLKEQYVKIFDRTHGRFYYGYKGKSKLLPEASWNRPKYCWMRSYPRDILPIFTVDVSAVIIQRKWRACLIRKFLWALARASYVAEFDPLLGKYQYTNCNSGEMSLHKPKMLGNQPWDPNNIPDWTTDQVVVFLRRIGLKQYANKFRDYYVDGYTFVLLDYEDYENMDILNRVHIRKIQVEIAKIFDVSTMTSGLGELHQLRRERIRKAKMFAAGATLIQAVFRGYRARKDLELTKEIARVALMEKRREQLVIERGTWWMDRDIPVHLPPVKNYGRKKVHLSCRGWGNWEGNEYIPAFPELFKKDENILRPSIHAPPPAESLSNDPTQKAYSSKEFGRKQQKQVDLPPVVIHSSDDLLNLKKAKKNVMSVLNPTDPCEDHHPTRIFTERLAKVGYDRRRYQKFRNLPVDVFIPKPIVESMNLDI